ncbi:RNA 2',3'-cyclic phosphodiesterase [Enterovirga rhinocerotis]|uniref:RNA 2',3'-cyclic phosphodiesterase n=1 Tax=Enterovirga rhinocerotis TaxID=1339210 RepID=A0A4R7CBN3_9HYPH|nr:RNA 2',3'-cyclic phosphodiesterase [Enterovirga rhinocerotis]TDR94855.1 2'-5' RNA ligase [Enterovirga rhinocerotis]
MPRLFTALEIPDAAADALTMLRGGLPGARWIDRENYHVTLRFFGDVDGATARDLFALLAESRRRGPIDVTLDALGSFGGDRPRSLFARVAPSTDLARFQTAQEKLARQAGLEPEGRKYTPHVTLARLRDVRAAEVATFIARAGFFPTLRFTAERFVLLSSRDSVGGGPYVIEAAYPFDSVQPAMAAAPAW